MDLNTLVTHLKANKDYLIKIFRGITHIFLAVIWVILLFKQPLLIFVLLFLTVTSLISTKILQARGVSLKENIANLWIFLIIALSLHRPVICEDTSYAKKITNLEQSINRLEQTMEETKKTFIEAEKYLDHLEKKYFTEKKAFEATILKKNGIPKNKLESLDVLAKKHPDSTKEELMLIRKGFTNDQIQSYHNFSGKLKDIIDHAQDLVNNLEDQINYFHDELMRKKQELTTLKKLAEDHFNYCHGDDYDQFYDNVVDAALRSRQNPSTFLSDFWAWLTSFF